MLSWAPVIQSLFPVTVLKEPMNKLSGCNGPNVDKGMFRLRAQQLRIGSFVLRDRLVTISRNKLEIRARPVDSLTEVSARHQLKVTKGHYLLGSPPIYALSRKTCQMPKKC